MELEDDELTAMGMIDIDGDECDEDDTTDFLDRLADSYSDEQNSNTANTEEVFVDGGNLFDQHNLEAEYTDCSNCGGDGYACLCEDGTCQDYEENRLTGESCTLCQGSGDCWFCKGKGYQNGKLCTSCNGDKKCQATYCEGGYALCGSCKGSGLCKICNGTFDCKTCEGTGKVLK